MTAPADADVLVDIARAALGRLDAADWPVRPEGFWCHVGPAGQGPRVQGWKLHVAATPLSASLVLARAVPVLVRHRCQFKFAATVHRLRELISRHADRGSGGKFLTAYPEGDDDALRALAEDLHAATEGLPGPGILSDRAYRPGSLVHYRFGAFSGVPVLGNDGGYEAMLVAPDGSLVLDQRRAWFTPPPWAPRDPFAEAPAANPAAGPKPVLLDGRYVVHEVIRHAYTGGVYRATDQRTGAAVIVKQARRHAGADVTGRDARDVRRYEADMLAAFADSGITPRVVALFEQQGDVFLVQEAVAGITLRQWASRNTAQDGGAGWGPPPEQSTRIALGLTELMAAVHAEGYVLRDFNPNNVMVTDDGDLRLIDLETLARPGAPVARAYTPGYGAPEHLAGPDFGPAPDQRADLFSLGATLFHLVTGADPALAPDRPANRSTRERIGLWLSYLGAGNPVAREHTATILGLLHENPAQRPDLAAVRDALAEPTGGDPTPASHTPDPARLPDADLKRMVVDGVDHLVATMRPDESRLWPAEGFATLTDPCNVQHGAAGVLGLLARVHATGPDPAVREAVATAAGWIRRRIAGEPRLLPGLHFGRSGTAWALLDAGRALDNPRLVDVAADLARRVPLRWPNPDVCHGASGAGLTQLRFWEATGDEEFRQRARFAADGVLAAAQRRDGLIRWPIPRDFASGLAGLAHLGFAHGVAGCGAFLLAAGRATDEAAYLDAATAAADTLLAAAEVEDGAARWPSDEDGGLRKTHWCSGSSGVGTFFVRLWQATGHQRLRDMAHLAAVAVRRTRWHAGPSQCHGLAGDAEFLLDLATATGDEQYRDWAHELAVGIYVRHAQVDGRLVAPDETATAVVADFNTGLAGVLAFLLRLRDGGDRLWLPESFTGPGAGPNPDLLADR
jgi:hypothetical protein